jgi:glycosyltransferase involved in cell wall biosynthesis
MRILFVSGWYPYPPDNGARIRILSLLKELGKYHSIHLVSFHEASFPIDGSRIDPLLEWCSTVDVVPRPTFNRRPDLVVKSLLSRKPPWIVNRYNPAMTHKVEGRIASENPDLLVISQVQNFPLLENTTFDVPVVLEQFEVGTIWNREERASGYQKITRAMTREIWSHYLSGHLSSLDGITVPSDGEEGILFDLLARGNSSNKRVVLIPNGVADEYTRLPPAEKESATMIYQGSLKFAANLDAMEFFLSEIMPLIESRSPDIVLRITGRNDDVDLSKFENHPNVDLTGYIDDVTGAVSSASVCVIPLRYGSGTRIKAIESMALGTPVVSTSKGVEGLGAKDGVHVLVADEPVKFADHVIRLLEDADLGRQLAKNARQLVQSKYTWSKLGKQFSDFCESFHLSEC